MYATIPHPLSTNIAVIADNRTTAPLEASCAGKVTPTQLLRRIGKSPATTTDPGGRSGRHTT
jgi:hypothetical protein